MPGSPPDASQELANRAEEVYSGAVDGIDSSELGTVVEELEAGAEALRVCHKGLVRSRGLHNIMACALLKRFLEVS